MLTFIEERRRRIRKAYEEGFAEGFEEGFAKGLNEVRAAIIRAASLNPRIAALLRDDPKIRQALREHGIEPPDKRDFDV